MSNNPYNTVFDAKRLIGRQFDDVEVQADMKHWPFKVVKGESNKPLIEVQFKGEKLLYAPGILENINRANKLHNFRKAETNSRKLSW